MGFVNVNKELFYCGCEKKVMTSEGHWFDQSKLHFLTILTTAYIGMC